VLELPRCCRSCGLHAFLSDCVRSISSGISPPPTFWHFGNRFRSYWGRAAAWSATRSRDPLHQEAALGNAYSLLRFGESNDGQN
jgi:hypothetical protein